MGGSSQEIGKEWLLLWHDGLCLGPLDAYLALEAQTKIVWKGRITESTRLVINKPDLWGGKKDQGGAVGPLSVMFGEADQMPNDFMTRTLGNQTVAWRGIATVAYEGGTWGANNPYQGDRSHKVERIKKGWDNDECWYPEKAAIPLAYTESTTLVSADVALDANGSSPDGTDGGFDFELPANSTIVVELGPSSDAWSYTPSDDYDLVSFPLTWTHRFGIRNLDTDEVVGLRWLETYLTASEARVDHADEEATVITTLAGNYRLFLYDATVDDNRGTSSYRLSYRNSNASNAKNPAHIILEQWTQSYGAGQPIETLNLDSFTAAADWYYDQGFGLCTMRDPDQESVQDYIDRICRVAGCSFSQSNLDGLWYIDIANGEYDIDSLPILTDDDVLEFEEVPFALDNAINSVSIKYEDPQRNETITTRRLQAISLIADFGENHQLYDFREIPTSTIAERVRHREVLSTTTPARAYNLVTTPKTRGWRKGSYFRAQLPKHGIADLVCLVAEGDDGKLASGNCQFKASQDIYSLPVLAYSGYEPGVDTRPPETAIPNEAEVAFEAPLIDVIAAMAPADFAALATDAGFIAGVAANPGGMLDFSLYADAGAGFEEKASGHYCPTCVLTDDIAPGQKVGISYTDGQLMESVEIGRLVLMNGEICRVDANDTDTQVLELGRGCADTVPRLHLAGTRLYFYSDYAAADPTEYVAGETINVKLPSRTGSEQLDLGDAATMPVTQDYRLVRPYPPADLKLNGVSSFDTGGGSGGSSGGGGSGGGGGTQEPPAMTPAGGPASTSPGPNGGYPDDAPYVYPLPTVDTDAIDGGDFGDAGDIENWRDKNGNPLDSRWSIVDGKLRYQGVGSSAAYYFGARFSLPWQPIPRYDVAVTADVATDVGVTASIGAAWGVSTSGAGLNYMDVSAAASYPEETAVSHDFIYKLSGLVSGFHYIDQIAVVNFVPVLSVVSPSALVVNATFDNVTATPTIIDMPTTAESLTNLDFSSGLDNWVKFPDATGSPYEPTISVSGGELSVTGVSQFHTTQSFINETPLSINDIGRYTGTTFEVWCDDTTVRRGFTQNGAIAGFITKYAGVYGGLNLSGAYQRGDWTEREAWLRQHVDGTTTPGLTLHEVITIRVDPGGTCKVRNINVKTTDDIIDPVPIP